MSVPADIHFTLYCLQLQAYLAQYSLTSEQIEDRYWKPHNEWAGDELYSMCIDLRGFYLKVRVGCSIVTSRVCMALPCMRAGPMCTPACMIQVGQFIGTRSDFIAEPICRRLSLLQDQVQSMWPCKGLPTIHGPVVPPCQTAHLFLTRARSSHMQCGRCGRIAAMSGVCVMYCNTLARALAPNQVPPMSADETRVILEAELGLRLANIFEGIDLDQPLGSASISQVRPVLSWA